ncbi:AAA domain (dynein-related subfamily) [Hyunsoonleella jejuensis]|uniref:AAA domain (Dynein-related subfamily) n=1 Tax=Hyunsoonleella jejuensis TaxID=419940 RepID=A0A1H9KDH6_9FLAO|nr:AAA family ATPase [Hyunsoonleella jejuensis]SEQ97200.1 AAA domain (dynein-related subfamily) [Hyunsoonleella jejuensis]
MSELKNSLEWSNEILDYLVHKRLDKPNLKFWLRQRDTNNRFGEGYWFQGTDDYIAVGFVNANAGNQSTRSVSFVVTFDENGLPNSKIEVIFKQEENERLISFYRKLVETLSGFEQKSDIHYEKQYSSNDLFQCLDEFLTRDKPIMDNLIVEMNLQSILEIPEKKFERTLKKTLKIQAELMATDKLSIILANITWNSKDWKEVSEDMSGHAWVGGDNIPHESWNFDYDNPRNEGDNLYGFVKFTNAPKVTGNNNLIIFYSQGKIVGFYGKTEVLKDWVNINERESYNLIADKNLSVVLPNKIDNIKDKGYLEGLSRVGQIGFSYLKKPETAISILDEAIELNPESSDALNNIRKWIMEYDSMKDKFHKWLIENGVESGKASAYIRAIDILINNFNINIYTENDLKALEDLYIDLKLHQTEKNGKYYFAKAKSYGEGRFYSAAIRAYMDFLKGNTTKESDIITTLDMDKEIDLNQIFFGPPGTGKTYHTINEAIKIVDPEFYKLNHDNRDNLKERFKLLLLNNDNEDLGQIGFTTFHQSFSYEDFIEGIKPIEPKEDDTHLKYDIQEGIFKRVCRLASDSLEGVSIHSESLISLSQEEYDKAHFYKMSLGNTQDEADNEVYDYCIENNVITIGYGNGLDFTGKNEKELRAFGEENDLDSYPVTAMNLFSNYLKVDDYVVISYGNLYVRAIAKVTGEYEYKEESPFPNNSDWKHFRKVEWIFENKKIGVKEIYNKNLQQQTIYKLEKKEIKPEFFVKEKKANPLNLPKNPKNFVIIIDEINRGNVSSIFGELITLIEKDKRANKDEELSVTLPYSKKEFKVPHNVYIIGTMNTADRSIEALDTALRRRFSFREMPPSPKLILTEGKLKNTEGMIGDINVVKILDTINDRIEKLIDKDHKIGHSYFLNIETEDELKDTFNDKVIPLLEEYFFGDFGKISLVLGSSFITKGTKAGVTFAKSNEYDPSIANDLLERSVYEVTSKDDWNFKAIYE